VTDFCEYENELSVSMKSRNFLISLFTPSFYGPLRTLTIFTAISILLYYFLFVSLSSLSYLVKHPLHLSAISVWAFYLLTYYTLKIFLSRPCLKYSTSVPQLLQTYPLNILSHVGRCVAYKTGFGLDDWIY
jgi:hypothetical protein